MPTKEKNDYDDYDEWDGVSTGIEEYKHSESFSIPKYNHTIKKYHMDTGITSYGFHVPLNVKNEKVVFTPLMDTPDVEVDKQSRYIVIIHDQTKIYKEPDIDSEVIVTVKAGDIFVLEKEKNYPDSVDEIPEQELEGLRDLFYSEEDIKETYIEYPGEIVDGYYNKWLLVRNNVLTGWVFGAYIFGVYEHGLTYKQSYRISELYKRGNAFPSYQDNFIFYGSNFYLTTPWDRNDIVLSRALKAAYLSDSQIKALESEYCILEKVSYDEYYLDSRKPDDMVSLYIDAASSKLNPLLITTDFVLHTFHLLFDRTLQLIEVNYFLPFTNKFCRRMYRHVTSVFKSSEDEKLKKSLEILAGYFAVALRLLEDPDFPDLVLLNQHLKDKVIQELALIDTASTMANSPLLGNTNVDYTLFRVRGHYTNSKPLSLYFKAMMWLGFATFPLDPLYTEFPDEYYREATRCAIILVKLLSEDSELFSEYKWFMENIRCFIGKSNDLTPLDYHSLYEQSPGLNRWETIADDSQIDAFMVKAKNEFPLPLGRGTAPGRVFQVVGQRFTIDSYFFSQLSHDSVEKRYKVKTCDILTVMGSVWGEEQVLTDKEQYPSYTPQLQKCKEYLNNMEQSAWFDSFYQSYISVLYFLISFPKETKISWFDSVNYMKKNHLAFLGGYTELKHDTLLYALQPFAAECGGGEITYHFKIDPLPKARGYIEPNLPFFRNLLHLYNRFAESSSGDLIMLTDMGRKWATFMKNVKWMYEFVKKEVNFEHISQTDYDELFYIPVRMGDVILPSIGDMHDDMSDNDYRMAIVTDIFTDPMSGTVLTLGTGIPHRIYMTIYDPPGGRRVCVGYTYSYYEFYHPQNERLNDDEWKSKVYDENGVSLKDKEPEWIKNMRYE